MPKFDAGSVGEIEYDFTSWGINDKGVVPEPSRAQVNKMMKDVQLAFKEMELGDVEDNPRAIAAAMQAIEEDDVFSKMTERLVECMAVLCGADCSEISVIDNDTQSEVTVKEWQGGKPSYQSLAALPYRVFMAFFGYIMNEVMSPEASTPGTTSTRITPLRSA